MGKRKPPTISEQVRKALLAYSALHEITMQEISRRTGIRPEQLSRFVHCHRGLKPCTLDHLGQFLRLQLGPV